MLFPKGKIFLAINIAVIVSVAVLVSQLAVSSENESLTAATVQPSLSVNVTSLEPQTLPLSIAANGDIAAWQEVSIGAEISDLRLLAVNVDIGDAVRDGQLLASYDANTVQLELAQSRAAETEAAAALAEATANAQRARGLKNSGALTEQQIQQYETAELIAQARLEMARAQKQAQQIRLAQTQVVAPDDGIITAHSATVGSVTRAGQELFRLTRDGRLEWRAEVPASDLDAIQPGQTARVTLPGGAALEGRVRTIAPLVNATTRFGLVYVDLPAHTAARAGMFARGEFELGNRQSLTLMRSAVQIRDGFGYVHRVGDDGRVSEVKVALGQQQRDRVEILSGLDVDDLVVASGGAFLGDGDHVQVIDRVYGAASTLKTSALNSGESQ